MSIGFENVDWKDADDSSMDVFAVSIIGIFVDLIILPFWCSVMISLTMEIDYLRNKFALWSANFTSESY